MGKMSKRNNYLNDTEQARRSSLAYLQFIFDNEKYLLQRRNGEKHLRAMRSISQMQNHNFTPKQMSYIDSVYEMVMEQLGFPAYKGQKSKYGVNFKA